MKYLCILFFLMSCLPQKETSIIYKDDNGNVENRYMPSYFKSDYVSQNGGNGTNTKQNQKTTIENDIVEDNEDLNNNKQINDQERSIMDAEENNKSVEKIIVVEDGETLLYFSRKYNTTVDSIAKLNNIKKPYRIYVGQKLKIMTNTNKIIGDKNKTTANVKIVVVQPDDNLLRIAIKNNMTLREVADLNNIKSPYTIYAGQKIKVYTNGKQETNKKLVNTDNNGQKTKNTTTNSGNYYIVESGDNIFYIAKKFNTTANKIIKTNNLKKPYNIYVGQKLIVDDKLKNENTSSTVSNSDKKTTENNTKSFVNVENSSSKLENENNFTMPIKGGEIVKKFGQQYDGKTFDGILIKANKGMEITATEEGEIIYASNELKDLGNVIIIKHKNKWLSIYGHCDTIKAKVKTIVRQGEVIGTVGDTGKADEPQLYFAIRRARTAVDPLLYINNK